MADRYSFSLESVLQLRRILKEQELVLLEEAVRHRDEILREALSRRDRAAGIEDRLARAESGDEETLLDVQDIQLQRDFIEHLLKEAEKLEAEADEAELEVQRQREVVLDRTKDQKVMEKLKEKDFATFQKDEQRRTDKEIDELVILRPPPSRE